MPGEQWQAVDDALGRGLLPPDGALSGAIERSRAAGLPEIQVAPNQGKQLMLLARAIGASRALEIGTLGGYSSIWIARGLAPGGRVTTLELDPRHAEVARANLAEAGLAERCEVIVGPAIESLPKLDGPFDMVFIDADKEQIPEYFEHAVRLSGPGGVIVVDNVVRDGKIADPDNTEPSVLGVRRLLDSLATDTRVDATAVQTVGEKGYDGYLMAVVNADPSRA